MYQIHRSQNRIAKLEEKTFGELGFRERDNLQEWIANNPEVLGEELLIIQKEFNGFADTNERLDLLALDKQGNLVIIENKLDDSGRDVTWQSLKYASYCASLSKEQIKDIYQQYLSKYSKNESAEKNLREFFDDRDFEELALNQGAKQRIVLVAANFRKEVTSTVLWLMNYNVRIQCFKVTPYQRNDDLFLDIAQILPTKETQEFAISMAEKMQDDIATENLTRDRQDSRKVFWIHFLNEVKGKSELYQNHTPVSEQWLGAGLGITGVGLNIVVSSQYARVEVYINRGNKELNKKTFDQFYALKDNIEKSFGKALTWERKDDKVTSRFKYQMDNVSYFNEEDWQKMVPFLITESEKLYTAVKSVISTIK